VELAAAFRPAGFEHIRGDRITSISRKIAFGANQSRPEASITITADPIPPGGYWS